MSAIVEQILNEIQKKQQEKRRLLVAIDGRCGSGKTTLAHELQARLQNAVIHMDDFYLRKEQRTRERYQEPGGNVDYERFLEEVLYPIQEGRSFSYCPYNVSVWGYKEPVRVLVQDVYLVEGSYSCHPALRDFYDVKIFLTVNAQEQMARIRRRNGEERAAMFRQIWIPLEEHYFRSCSVEQKCDLYFDTSERIETPV